MHSDLLHGVENAPYLLRQDHVLIGSGRMNASMSRVEGPLMSIRVKVEHKNWVMLDTTTLQYGVRKRVLHVIHTGANIV